MTEYTIKELEDVFKIHSDIGNRDHQKLCKEYQAQFNEPYPHEFFDFCGALCVICKEINQLKDGK